MKLGRRRRNLKATARLVSACAIAALGLCAVLSSQALASADPTATTGTAQQVAFASATVTATVNPAGASTSYYFQYGTTSSYGLQTAAASAGAGSSDVPVSQPLSGLAASTTYHFRVVATSGGVSVDGHDATFTTTSTPSPGVSTGTASSIGFASATLAGSVNPQGVATTFWFEYGTTLAYGAKTAVQAAGEGTAARSVSGALSGLGASTTYHYRLVASSAGGTVVGGDQTFTTAKTPAPVVVTGAPANVATTSATVNGTVNPGGVSTNYYFQYGTTSSYGHTTATHSAGAGTAAAAVSAALGGLAQGTSYHYRLVAVSAGGTVAGRDATFATAKTPSPGVATGAASALTTTTATVTGTVDPHGVATSYYFLYGIKSPTTRTPSVSAGAGSANVGVSAEISGLAVGTTYSYRLVAVGARTVEGSIQHFTTATVPAALSLTATANPVRAGASVTLTGTLTGTGVGIRTVALEVEHYPYTRGFAIVGGAVATSATGTFTLTLPALDVNSRVRAVTVGGAPALASPVTLERVAVRVAVHVRRHGRAVRFTGAIAPAGAPVQIQIQRRFRGAWITIVRTTTHRGAHGPSLYARTLHSPHPGRYRIVAHVRNGSRLSGRSRVVTLG
jgi:hypothetical protein